MSKKLFAFLLSLVLVFSLTSCKHKSKSKEKITSEYSKESSKNHVFSAKSNSGGNAGEVEVVIDDKLWEGRVGDTIFYYLTQPFPALPQDEPFFKVLHIAPNALQSIYLEHRNIIIFKFSPQYKPKWQIERDKWAYNQLVITYFFPDTQSFYQGFPKTVGKLLDTLYSMELYRYQLAFSEYKKQSVIDYIQKRYGVYLLIPQMYQIYVDKPKFLWIERETAKTIQGIFVYFTPYTDSITLAEMVRRRDSVTKLNVPGPDPGSYMQIEHAYPIFNGFVNLNGKKAFIMRGLWRTENSFMGGPFVSYTVKDEKNHRLVTVDGFVYAGKLDKRLYLWQVEAILRTFKLVE